MVKRTLISAVVVAAVIVMLPVLLKGETLQPVGYLTIGENVVVTPWNLQPGDEVSLISDNGTVVLKRVISRQTSVEPLTIPTGSYRLTITRKGHIIDNVMVPIKS